MTKRKPYDHPAIAIPVVIAFLVCVFFAWRWFDGYRAGIWAEELRKAGVTAPQVPK